MMNHFCPSAKDILGTINMLKVNNNLARWSSITSTGYNETAKQALNCQIAIILFEYVKHYGIEVDPTLLPRIALYRGFEKTLKCDITTETFNDLLCEDQFKKAFQTLVSNEIITKTGFGMRNHICDLENTVEAELFKAATAIATYIELQSIKRLSSRSTYKKIEKKLLARLKTFSAFPIVNDIRKRNNNLRILFENLHNLRNRIRWIREPMIIKYNVLGHSYDVGILNYLLTLAEKPDNLEEAYQAFAVGLFHDIAENWTGDIPSPVKKAVTGFEEKTEEYEVYILKKEVFSRLPEWIHPIFESYMLEMLPDNKRKLFKSGDRLAAIIEASAQIISGSHHARFRKAIGEECEVFGTLGIRKEIIAEIYKSIDF